MRKSFRPLCSTGAGNFRSPYTQVRLKNRELSISRPYNCPYNAKREAEILRRGRDLLSTAVAKKNGQITYSVLQTLPVWRIGVCYAAFP